MAQIFNQQASTCDSRSLALDQAIEAYNQKSMHKFKVLQDKYYQEQISQQTQNDLLASAASDDQIMKDETLEKITNSEEIELLVENDPWLIDYKNPTKKPAVTLLQPMHVNFSKQQAQYNQAIENHPEFLDQMIDENVDFDSDSENEQEEGSHQTKETDQQQKGPFDFSKMKKELLTNDKLFYHPCEDELNSAWVKRKLLKNQDKTLDYLGEDDNNEQNYCQLSCSQCFSAITYTGYQDPKSKHDYITKQVTQNVKLDQSRLFKTSDHNKVSKEAQHFEMFHFSGYCTICHNEVALYDMESKNYKLKSVVPNMLG